jgi:hypothetical protein
MTNEMGGACGTYGVRRSSHRVWWGNIRKRDRLENLGVYGSIIFKVGLRNLPGGRGLG